MPLFSFPYLSDASWSIHRPSHVRNSCPVRELPVLAKGYSKGLCLKILSLPCRAVPLPSHPFMLQPNQSFLLQSIPCLCNHFQSKCSRSLHSWSRSSGSFTLILRSQASERMSQRHTVAKVASGLILRSIMPVPAINGCGITEPARWALSWCQH